MPELSKPLQTRLRRIQTALGVRADGVLGPETLSALEAQLEIRAAPSATSLECSASGLALIVEFEVSSKTYYEKRLKSPIWPGEQSGVTIGIGYDLGMTPREQIESDWGGRIPDVDLVALLAVQGVTGKAAKILAEGLSHISIPYTVAESAFYQSTLPHHARLTRDTYPGVEKLPADAQAMLLSLIYNRGTSLDKKNDRRREMAAIKPLVKKGAAALADIAQQVESMARLWPTSSGLRDRRRREARLIRGAKRTYDPAELVRL